ncbi:ExeA family protein [Fuerstiella marisgermanici]|uniref:Putative secretion ATPase, PEP-CTERM locus subfamily n=1 Tax=Fuerstiella marisgermanici TaxID=1891926 RepID=A0A1P8WFI1_9PLAN|nr:AAA family ATPase [Fuerstiella marisgermanici]APZ92787.1 putative secretion ATPase, PEP-CTERM locus subfamily [Fuerstiella marisgermanici]
MYETYWNLSRKPFGYRVAVDDLYRSKAVQSAALRLRYCIDNNAGAALLLGASGLGKSSLVQLLKADGTELRPFVHVAFPRLSPSELTRAVACELLQQDNVEDLPTDVLLVKQYNCLLKHAKQGNHPVIVFDEAHLLSNDTLDEVVLPLLNLADTDYGLQFSVILVGQAVLGSHIARNAQLRERIAVTATMHGLSENETADYIRTRLADAGCEREIFTDEAISAVMNLSGGNPRRINRLCDMALLVGYSDQAQRIEGTDIEALATEILPAAA